MYYKLIMVFLLFTACTVDHPRFTDNPYKLDFNVSPSVICPGDSVTLSWDTIRTPRSSDYCATPNASYGTPQTCTVDRDCPTGSDIHCIDSKCLNPSLDNVDEIDFGNGCPLDVTLSVTANDLVRNEPNTAVRPTQNRINIVMHMPANNTAYVVQAEPNVFAGVVAPLGYVTVIERNNLVKNLSFGSPSCRTASQPLQLTLGDNNTFTTSPSVVLSSVRNNTNANIVLTANGLTTVLRSDESTNIFNNTLPSNWSAQLESDRTRPPLPSDCIIDNTNYISIPIEITLFLTCRT